MEAIDPFEQRPATLRIDTFFRKVDESLKVCHRGERLPAQFFHRPAKATLQLPGCGPRRCLPAGGNQVHDRLSLGEIHLSVEKGPARELTSRSRVRSRSQDGAQHGSGYHTPSMAADLDQVLTGVTARRAKDGEQNLIEHNTVLLDAPPLHAARRTIKQRTPSAKNPTGNFQRARPTDPHHGQRTGSGRSGQCGNGVRTGHYRTATRAPRSTIPSASSSRSAAMKAVFWGMVPTETRIHSGRP